MTAMSAITAQRARPSSRRTASGTASTISHEPDTAADPDAFVEELAATRIGRTFNQYAVGSRAALLRARLASYLYARAGASTILVGEAPGYRGARVSGIPFTSERQLTGTGPAEAAATIVHRTLAELGIESDVLLWNAVPTHPGTASCNRRPTREEVAEGVRFAVELARRRRVIAVGRIAHEAVGGSYVRHPSRGGARAFRDGLLEFSGA